MATKLNLTQRTISKWESGEVKLSDEILEKYLEVLGKDEEWVETIEDRINLVQSNNTFNDSSTCSLCMVYNNNSSSQAVEPLMNSLIELAKAQQEILEILKGKV